MTILVTAALPHELSHVFRYLNTSVIRHDPPTRFYGPAGLRFLITGVGRHAVTSMDRSVILDGMPDMILNVGFCGALDSRIRDGELITASEAGFLSGHNAETISCLNISSFTPLPDFLAALKESLPLRIIIHEGRIVTIGHAMKKADITARLPDDFLPSACDMETYFIAEWAIEHGIPFMVFRAVTDRADEDIPPELFAVTDENGSYRPFMAITVFMRNPSLIPTGVMLGMRAKKAAAGIFTVIDTIVRSIQSVRSITA